MKTFATFAIPAAIALACVPLTSTAQDKPAEPVAKKAATAVSSPSKASKASAQAPVPANAGAAKALGARSEPKQSTPAVNYIAPAMERGHGCHGDDSDA